MPATNLRVASFYNKRDSSTCALPEVDMPEVAMPEDVKKGKVY